VTPFRYTGVQWVEVTGLPDDFTPTADFLTGLQTRTDLDVAGSVNTSSDLVNRLHHVSHHSIASNMQSVFTDCPGREKLGWLADVRQSLGAIDRQFGIGAFLPHMSRVMAEAQLPSGPNRGLIPEIAPELTVFDEPWEEFRIDINWGSTMVLVPWWQWKEHGDLGPAREHYDAMLEYWEYIHRVQEGTGADAHLLLGPLADWAASDNRTSGWLAGTAGYYTMTVKLQEMAAALGHDADVARLADKARLIKDAFNDRFFNPELHRYTNEGTGNEVATQAAQALPLEAGLAPADERENVLDALEELIRAYHPDGDGPHASGGMVSLGQTLRVLQANGRNELIWEMLNQTTRPSWGYFVQPTVTNPRGRTTMPEHWDLAGSQNHMILLQIDEWFSTGLAGIQRPENSIGYRRIVIDPAFVGTDQWPLDEVSGSYETPYGEVTSAWRRIGDGDQILLTVTVPPGTKADVHLPRSRSAEDGDRVVTAAPGTHRFSVPAPR
jgi:alpha-L-rhamnosidase